MRPYPHPGSSMSREDNGDSVIINSEDNYNYKEFPYYNSNPQSRGGISYQTYDNNGRITSYYDTSYYPHAMAEKNKKRHHEYDIHPNDVIKHEASRLASTASAACSNNYHSHCNANKLVFVMAVVLSQMMLFCFDLR